MKSSIILFLLSIIYISSSAQNVFIPDSSFKSYLVSDLTINLNADTNISVSEANSYLGTLICAGRSIMDLKGIEAFINITEINCSYNLLTALNFNQNPKLTYIYCGNNPLISIDLSNNPVLTNLNTESCNLTNLNISQNPKISFLNCSQNPLHTLNLTQHPDLTDLICNGIGLTTIDLTQNYKLLRLTIHSNGLTTLNTSQNSLLFGLYCSNNKLSSLDLSSNTSMKKIFCDNNKLTYLNLANGSNTTILELLTHSNPNLKCIQVDNPAFSGTSWIGVNYTFDAGASFNTYCVPTSVKNHHQINAQVYPNPCRNIFNLEIPDDVSYSITDIQGKKHQSGNLEKGINQIDIHSLTAGIYLVNISNPNGGYKVIKITKR